MNALLRKPKAICQFDETIEKLTTSSQKKSCIIENLQRIENMIKALDCTLRKPTDKDIWKMNELTYRQFSPEAAKGISLYDLYRFINYGQTVVIEDDKQQILAYDLSIAYDDPHKTSYEIAIAVASELSGHRLGAHISTYGALLGWQNQSKVRKSSVHPMNLASVKNLLNYVGFTVHDYNRDFLGKLGPRLVLALPLTAGAIFNNRIDMGNLLRYIENNERNHDFQLVACYDFNGIEKLYQTTDFKIMAFLPKEIISENEMYFAARPGQF